MSGVKTDESALHIFHLFAVICFFVAYAYIYLFTFDEGGAKCVRLRSFVCLSVCLSFR